MWGHRALVWGLLVVLVVALPVAAVLPAGAAAGVAAPAQATATDDGAQRLHMAVQLRASGDARWAVRTYVPLEDEAEADAFRDLGRAYANGTADVDVDTPLFRRYVAAARDASGRDMAIPTESVERDWAIEDGTGVLRLRFTWTNFARAEGDRLVVDDAFQTPSGTWLPKLEAGQELVVRPPEDGRFLETPKRVTDATLRWEGPATFGPDYFYVVYSAGDSGTPTGTTPPTTSEPPTSTPGSDLPAGTLLLVGVLLGGGGAAYLWLRRGPGDEGAGRPAPGGEPAAREAVTDGSRAAASAGADAGAAGDDAATPEEPAEPTPEDPFAGVDVEMLSDEERVLRLLEANGGRMKQARIVKETDWSNAKVSQLLSGMAEDGEIDKLRIGRENLISLPDVDVDSFEE